MRVVVPNFVFGYVWLQCHIYTNKPRLEPALVHRSPVYEPASTTQNISVLPSSKMTFKTT